MDLKDFASLRDWQVLEKHMVSLDASRVAAANDSASDACGLLERVQWVDAHTNALPLLSVLLHAGVLSVSGASEEGIPLVAAGGAALGAGLERGSGKRESGKRESGNSRATLRDTSVAPASAPRPAKRSR